MNILLCPGRCTRINCVGEICPKNDLSLFIRYFITSACTPGTGPTGIGFIRSDKPPPYNNHPLLAFSLSRAPRPPPGGLSSLGRRRLRTPPCPRTVFRFADRITKIIIPYRTHEGINNITPAALGVYVAVWRLIDLEFACFGGPASRARARFAGRESARIRRTAISHSPGRTAGFFLRFAAFPPVENYNIKKK